MINFISIIHIIGLLLIPNKIISFMFCIFNLYMIRTPYLCLLNSIINIIVNFSWQGLVFSILWIVNSQDFVIGKIPEKFKSEILEMVEQSKNLKPNNSEIFWTSIYADNGIITNIKYSKDFYNYISNLRWKILEFWFKRINGFGTLINPVDSVEQDFHIDYTSSYTSLFIPIENCTTSNMTQIITDSFIWGNFYPSRNLPEKDMLTIRSCESIRSTIFKPDKWSILILPPCTFHRGVKNNSKMNRTLFWISYQSKKDPIEYENAIQDFTKKSIDL